MINTFLFVLFLAGEALSVLVSLFRVTDIVICDTWRYLCMKMLSV